MISGLSRANAIAERASRSLQVLENVQIPRIYECNNEEELNEYEQELHASLGSLAALVRQLVDDVDDAETEMERVSLSEAAKRITQMFEGCV